MNAHFDDRLMFKFGRMLTPFLYEYYGVLARPGSR